MARSPYAFLRSGQGQPPAQVRTASREQENLVDQDGVYNPRSFGGRQAVRDALPSYSHDSRMFDRSGQINAVSKEDAMVQIQHLMQGVAASEANASLFRQASTMGADERRKVIAAAMQDPTGEGFALVGQELLAPIKDMVDYEGWSRKVLRKRDLQQGELFRIPKDVRATAWVVGQDGQALESQGYGRFIQPTEFKIAAFPTVDIEDIMQMNYDVLDRMQDTARQEIEVEEDKRTVALLDRASTTFNTVTTYATMGVAALESVRRQVERHRLVVSKFMINRDELSDIVITMSGQVDPVTERELLLSGWIGNFVGAKIYTAAGTGVEQVVPSGTFYAITDGEYLGELGVRLELFSEPYNMYPNRRTKKGWAFIEMIGLGVGNARSVAKGTK